MDSHTHGAPDQFIELVHAKADRDSFDTRDVLTPVRFDTRDVLTQRQIGRFDTGLFCLGMLCFLTITIWWLCKAFTNVPPFMWLCPTSAHVTTLML